MRPAGHAGAGTEPPLEEPRQAGHHRHETAVTCPPRGGGGRVSGDPPWRGNEGKRGNQAPDPGDCPRLLLSLTGGLGGPGKPRSPWPPGRPPGTEPCWLQLMAWALGTPRPGGPGSQSCLVPLFSPGMWGPPFPTSTLILALGCCGDSFAAGCQPLPRASAPSAQKPSGHAVLPQDRVPPRFPSIL